MPAQTIDDVTREQWARLTEAAINLLAGARMMFWLSGKEQDPDTSVRECLDEMADALTDIGLPQSSLDEFMANVEDMLKSGKSPEEWRKTQRVKAKRAN